ncbi:hypothetical protein BKA67DRAFT_571795 [Truncatella angustata]|uniref:Uncharacterized protein n=1 Tax=Truncatella angustata TaxID=152316 RepID=A0A9P8UGS8_9PEZI|nr:uncharacterized protein BKA67DRAFT_571795 [Truncatella angustata]KAH6651747.1 hypothetical protein BKA67DRAFT_571795 [Truncatella angustata]
MATPPPSRGPRVRGAPRGRPLAPPPPATPLKAPASNIKRVIWTAAFAAVTMVGTIYGAGLKTQQEFKAEKQQIVESTPEDRIRDLETRRAILMTFKMPLDRKLKALQDRMRAQEAEAKAKAEAQQMRQENESK